MIGAIIGDIIGSVYERENIKTKDFVLFSTKCRFTDDTVLTVALMEAILDKRPYAEVMVEYAKRYANAGYGKFFKQWVNDPDRAPYNSFGNGSAMRISPCAWAYDDLDVVLEKTKEFTEITHNHILGIQGAQQVAGSIFLARKGNSKEDIKKFLAAHRCELDFTLDEIRPSYKFDVTCQGSVPQAIQAFMESDNYIDAIRNAISIGGDSDTIACMTGGIAEAYYGDLGVNEFGVNLRDLAYCCLNDDLIRTIERFESHLDA